MDKKYLGLGVIFKAIDKGFTKTVKQVQGSLSATNENLDKVKKGFDGFESKNFTKDISNLQEAIDKSFNIKSAKSLDDLSESSTDVTRKFKILGNQKDKLIHNFNNFDNTLTTTENSFSNLKNGIDNVGFDKLNDLWTNFKVFDESIKPVQGLQEGLYALEDQMINLSLASEQAAKKEQLGSYLNTLRNSGRLTEKQFQGLSSALNDISEVNFPQPNIDTLNQMNDFIREQRDLLPRLKSGIDGWSQSSIGLEIAIDKANKTFEAEQKIKAINKYRLELQNLHNQGKISSKDFETISKDLNKLSDTFIKRAKDPQTFFDKIRIGAKTVSRPLREVGASIFDFGKTVIANMPSVTDGLLGKGEVSELASKLDFLKTKMSLVMSPEQANKFNSTLIGVMRTTGVTAEQAETLANSMNRFGVSVDDSAKMMPFLGKLVGRMGMDAGQAAEMGGLLNRSLGLTGKNAEKLVTDFYAMGKAHGFVDFLEDLPAITKDVAASFNKLGILNDKTSEKAIKSTGSLTAMYRKMGVEQKAAVAAATKMQGVLSDMTLDIDKLSVGLEPENFDAMIDVAGEISRLTGKSADEAFKMIQEGALKPAEFQKQMMDIADKTTNPQDLKRFGLILRKTMSDEAANLITNKDLRAKANAEDIEAQEKLKKMKKGKGSSALEKDAETMGNTFDVSQKLLKTNHELANAMGEMAGKDAILQSWNKQMSTWQDIQDHILKQDFAGKMFTLSKTIEAGGAAAGAYFEGLTKVGDGLASVGVYAKAAEEALRSLGGLFAGLQGFGSILGGLFLGLLPSIGKFVASFLPIGGILNFFKGGKGDTGGFFKGIGEKLSSFGKGFGNMLSSAWEGISGFVSKAVGGVADMASKAWSSISSMASTVTGKLSDMASAGVSKVGDFVTGVGAKLKDISTSALSKVGDKFTDLAGKASGAFEKMSGSLAGKAGLVGAAALAGVAIGNLISDLIADKTKGTTKEGFQGDVIERAMFRVAKALNLDVVKENGPIINGKKMSYEDIQKESAKPVKYAPFKTQPKAENATPENSEKKKNIKLSAQEQLQKVGGEVFDLKMATGQAQNQYEGLKQAGAAADKIAEAKANFDNMNKQYFMKQDELKKLQTQAAPAPQQGAPNAARNPTANPTVAKEKGNTLDDVVKTLNELKESFIGEVRSVGNRPVNVALLGDAKKFFKAINAENMNNIGPYANNFSPST